MQKIPPENTNALNEEAGRKIAEEMLAFTTERRYTESVNDVIIGGLSVFVKAPQCAGASLFLLDKDALTFNYSYSLPLSSKRNFIQDYSTLLNEGVVSEVLKSGKAIPFRDKVEKDKSIILFPMIMPSELTGLILTVFDYPVFDDDSFLIRLLSVHSNAFANLIYNYKIAQKIKNSGDMIEQKVSDRTMDLNFQIKELQNILEYIQSGILIIDENSGELINANQAALNIFKCSLLDLKKRDLYKELTDKEFKIAYNNEEIYPDEMIITDAGGSQVLVIKKETRMRLFGKRILLISILDLSERKTAQRLLKQNEERYHKLADNMIDLICEMDKKGKILYASPSYKKILGYDEDELIGADSFEMIHPDDQPRICEKYLAYIKLGIGGRDELRVRHKDGHYSWIESIGEPLLSESGELIGAILSSRDINSRKESEEALRKSEEQFRYIWKSSLDGMILLDNRGIILMVNDAFCRMIELDKSRLEKQHFEVIHDEADRKRIRLRFEEAISFNKVEPYSQQEFTLWNKKKVWFQISSSLLFQGGSKSQVLSIYRNISNQKQLEQELIDINLQKDKFFSIMAHDLKSPFNGLMGLTKYLIDNYHDLSSDEIGELLVDVNSSSFYIYNLLENLLSWSRIQMDRMEFNPLPVNISELAVNNINLLKNNALHKRITLIDETLPHITAYADEFMINSCILNLISNAIKFTPKDGVVKIRTYKNQDKVVLEVRDNGIGISKEVSECIFKIDSFHSTIGTANEKGTGLGLKIAKELVEKNGGKISIESSEGKGCMIRVELVCC